jgi:hypothetical protein
MRTSQQLTLISAMADELRKQRGDTEWSDQDRERVNLVYEMLLAVGPIERRYSREPGS